MGYQGSIAEMYLKFKIPKEDLVEDLFDIDEDLDLQDEKMNDLCLMYFQDQPPVQAEEIAYLNISSEKWKEVPLWLWKCSSLVHLDLSNNNLIEFPEYLSEYLQKLEILDLSDNHRLKFLPDLCKFKSLKEIYLQRTPLSKISVWRSFRERTSARKIQRKFRRWLYTKGRIAKNRDDYRIDIRTRHLTGIYYQEAMERFTKMKI